MSAAQQSEISISRGFLLNKLAPYKPRQSGDGWKIVCPDHPGAGKDRNLSVFFRDDKVCFKCWSHGCESESIKKALGLWEERAPVDAAASSRIIAYETYDRAGKLIAVQKRNIGADGKKIGKPWWERNGKLGLDKLNTNEFPLYGSQRINGFDPSRPIHVCEGQTATDALLPVMVQALGTYGTSYKPTPKVFEGWAKDKTFVLWPDNDTPGDTHMREIRDDLKRAGAAKVILLDTRSLPAKGDAVEWLHSQLFERGIDKQELIELMKGEEVPGLPVLEVFEKAKVGAVVVCLADVQPEKVTWLFENRVPRGDITLLVGDPGTGKSTFSIDLAARVTTGRGLPGEPDRAPGNVVYITAEDGLAKTVRPRMEAAGADLSRMFAIAGIHDDGEIRQPSFPEDLSYLEDQVKEHKAELVIIDPLMAFIGGKIDSHKDQEIRRIMGGLSRLAANTGAAILMINHMNKVTGGPALYRSAGSIGIIGAARSALLFAKDPEDKGDTGLRILASLKSNLGPTPPSLQVQLVSAVNGSSMFRVIGTVAQDADGLTAPPVPGESSGALSDAVEALRQILAEGKVSSTDVRKSAKEVGISERTLWRAKGQLGVDCSKDGAKGWFWELPTKDGRLGRDGKVPVTTGDPDSANDPEDAGRDGDLGRLPTKDSPPKSAKSAKSAKATTKLGRDVSNNNNYTILKSAKSANKELTDSDRDFLEAFPPHVPTPPEPPTDPIALEEFENFTEEQRASFYTRRVLHIERGVPRDRAERDAAAEVLKEAIMGRPSGALVTLGEQKEQR